MTTRTTRLALAAVVLLVLAGCGSDAKDRAATATTVTNEQGIVVVPTDAVSSASAPSSEAQEAGPSTAETASSSDVDESSGVPGTVPPTLDGHVPVGQFAPAVLRPDRATSVIVEVRAQSGASLRSSSLDHLSSVLRSVTAKPVDVTTGQPILGGAKAWSADELRAEADAQGAAAQGAARAVLRVLVVHGSFGGDDGVLGVSVRGDTAVIFSDQVEASGSVLTGSAAIESAVVTHEAGHLLGLVDLYLHTGRQDTDHPGHSTNQGSVMYWAVESSLVGDILSNGPPQEFDAADLADLATIKGGA